MKTALYENLAVKEFLDVLNEASVWFRLTDSENFDYSLNRVYVNCGFGNNEVTINDFEGYLYCDDENEDDEIERKDSCRHCSCKKCAKINQAKKLQVEKWKSRAVRQKDLFVGIVKSMEDIASIQVVLKYYLLGDSVKKQTLKDIKVNYNLSPVMTSEFDKKNKEAHIIRFRDKYFKIRTYGGTGNIFIEDEGYDLNFNHLYDLGSVVEVKSVIKEFKCFE